MNTDKHNNVMLYVERELRNMGIATLEVRKTGSAWYGDANPADYDLLILLPKQDLPRLSRKLQGYDWEDCYQRSDSPEYQDDTNTYYKTWAAFRKHDANIIVTDDEVWFYRSLAAAHLVKYDDGMQFATKDERIDMFRKVRDGIPEGS